MPRFEDNGKMNLPNHIRSQKVTTGTSVLNDLTALLGETDVETGALLLNKPKALAGLHKRSINHKATEKEVTLCPRAYRSLICQKP